MQLSKLRDDAGIFLHVYHGRNAQRVNVEGLPALLKNEALTAAYHHHAHAFAVAKAPPRVETRGPRDFA